MVQEVRLAGKQFLLAGRRLEPGEHVPNFTAIAADLSEVRLADLGAAIKVITFFPSLDTSVCSDQVREFNRRALGAAAAVRVVGISMDLPFAQKRFVDANAIGDMALLSDHRFASFGATCGVLVEELRLLCRGAFVIDGNNILRFSWLSKELEEPVDFDAVMAAIGEVRSAPVAPGPAFPWRCIPCDKGTGSLRPEKLDELLARDRNWKLEKGKGIVKEFSFRDFDTAMRFADIVAAVSEEEGYDPCLAVDRNSLKVRLDTDGGLTENELVMSRIIDDIKF
jgi:thioredoxin-dependent peroxiredoxin